MVVVNVYLSITTTSSLYIKYADVICKFTTLD